MGENWFDVCMEKKKVKDTLMKDKGRGGGRGRGRGGGGQRTQDKERILRDI
jgi:hypothetical protein